MFGIVPVTHRHTHAHTHTHTHAYTRIHVVMLLFSLVYRFCKIFRNTFASCVFPLEKLNICICVYCMCISMCVSISIIPNTADCHVICLCMCVDCNVFLCVRESIDVYR